MQQPAFNSVGVGTGATKTGSPARMWLGALERSEAASADATRLMGDVVAEWAALTPDNPALLSPGESLTYGRLLERINRYARWARAAGVLPGERICLMMEGRPDYLAAWLGVTLVGAVAALINTKLVGPSLAHCVTIAQSRHILIDPGFIEAARAATAGLPDPPRLWSLGNGGAAESALAGFDGQPLRPDERPTIRHDDLALLIYTSGTTGLPKAARVSHRRVLQWGHWFAGLAGVTPSDRIYDCLPLCHSVGGVAAPCAMLAAGASVAIADGFSARRFWDDVTAWDCTLVQYIGELCRYLLKAPAHPLERAHRLRLICGNGLRGDIWEAFQERFAIPRILEFYAATEGNFSLFNVEGKVGAVGRVPPLLAHRFPAALARFDAETGQPARGADGLCIACAPGETGEALGRIGRPGGAGAPFEGYTAESETQSKILRDVFAPGDAWFRTGDLMRRDEEGFFYFIDRIGDTFRWKGENVATSEVEAAIAACPGIALATVYGVEVPGADGRAGMAAIVTQADFDPARLARHLAGRLPAYARPIFLRVMTALETTETFKLKKRNLARQGFDPALIRDPLYLADEATQGFAPLTPGLFARIVRQELRL